MATKTICDNCGKVIRENAELKVEEICYFGIDKKNEEDEIDMYGSDFCSKECLKKYLEEN